MYSKLISRLFILFFFFVSLLFLARQSGYCDNPSVRVELMTQKSEISLEESEVPVDIKITNIGSSDLKFAQLNAFTGPSIKTAGYRIHLTTNDPSFELIFHQTTSSGDPIPMITLKPGESFSTSMVGMNIKSGRLGESVTFKVGFKLLENSTPVWSNPVTIKLKNVNNVNPKAERPLHLKLDASMKSNEIAQMGTVHVQITNTTKEIQNIVGASDVFYGDWRTGHRPDGYTFAPLRSDSRYITVDTGSSSCNSHFRQFNGLTLKPGETWEADCKFFYEGGAAPKSRPITFRMGILSPGQEPIWSNEVTLHIANPS